MPPRFAVTEQLPAGSFRLKFHIPNPMTPDYIRQHFPSPENGIVSTRRQFLEKVGMGFGMLGLASLLKPTGLMAANAPAAGAPDVPFHFPGKAKHVIQIFLNGAPSHIDTWDPKPELSKLDGKPLPGGDGLAFGSPFKFIKQGKSGIEVSEVFPHLGKLVDVPQNPGLLPFGGWYAA